MTIYNLKTMQSCEIKGKTAVALGIFDGCHLGHASVLRNVFYAAKEKGVESVVYTFEGNTLKGHELILTLDEKIKQIRRFGIDYIAIDAFENVKEMSGEKFFYDILVDKLGAICASCGFNYRFGKGAAFDAQDLSRLFEKIGGSVQICDKIEHDGESISSTLIKNKIKSGEIEQILSYMNPYSVYACVEKGKGLGKELGIATINQRFPNEKVVPKKGVYITECEIGEDVYPSVTNVGYRPTTDGDNSRLNMETHIIGYSGDLYSSWIRVNFYKFLRDERKFDSLAQLVEQIEKDKAAATEYFGYHFHKA